VARADSPADIVEVLVGTTLAALPDLALRSPLPVGSIPERSGRSA
jgi:hypothetical protein